MEASSDMQTTTDRGGIMAQAACSFSLILTENRIKHAFIGGFAVRTLGHTRATDDVDVLVDVNNPAARGSLLHLVIAKDRRFSIIQLGKLIFTATDSPNEPIPVEVLMAGYLGLPPVLLIHQREDGKLSYPLL
jgi:hypothetical protein